MSHVSGRDIVLDVGVLCNSEDITLTLTVTTDFFNGMIYPKGLSKNSTCMTEYIQQEASIIMQGTGLEVETLSRLKVAVSVVRQEVELLTPPPSLSPRHYNHN